MVRTSWCCLQDAGKQAGLRGGAAHLSGRSRCWRCSTGPRCLQRRPAASDGCTGPGTSAEVEKGLRGGALHWRVVVERGVNTHRVVCEPLQNDRSGKGVARRKGRVTARSDPPPPSAPAHTGSKGLKGKCASSAVQGTALGTGFREVWPHRRPQVPLHELGVAEVSPALHGAVLLLRHGRRRPRPGPPPADTAAHFVGRPAALPAPLHPARPPGAAHHPPSASSPELRARTASVQSASHRSGCASSAMSLPPRSKPGVPRCSHQPAWGAASSGPEGGGASGGRGETAPRDAIGYCAAEAPPSAR